MSSDKDTARIRRKRDFVKKNMDKFQRPVTHTTSTEYARKPKKKRPIHEIDPDDPFVDELEIWNE